MALNLPDAASLQRTDLACRKVEEILRNTPGVEYYMSIAGFNLLNNIMMTSGGFFIVTLKDWKERERPEEQSQAIMAHLNRELAKLPQSVGFAFSPPAIPGIGTAGGRHLRSRGPGRQGHLLSGRKTSTSFWKPRARDRSWPSWRRPSCRRFPRSSSNVDRDKVLKQGIDLGQVYQTLQTFMGGYFVNYFNRFGRQWQVYVQAEGEYRSRAENIGQFYVYNDRGTRCPFRR